MNTMQAEYKTDIARLSEQLAKRDVQLIRWMFGIAGLALALAKFWD